jgi:single-strand DNA-binding protein
MAGEAIISVTGNLGGDAELRQTPQGIFVTSFSIANTPRVKKNNEWTDGETIWFRCYVWGKDAASAANELHKGTKVFVSGRFSIETFVSREQEERKIYQINVDSYGIVPRNVPEPQIVKNDKPIEDPIDDPWA